MLHAVRRAWRPAAAAVGAATTAGVAFSMRIEEDVKVCTRQARPTRTPLLTLVLHPLLHTARLQ